jgi:ABC-type amino acid transport substrate-binding protein
MRSRHIIIALLGAALSCAAQAQESINVATSGQHPPFNAVAEDGRVSGFDADLVRALCDQIEVKCRLKAVDDEQLLAGLKDSQFDAAIATALLALQGQSDVIYSQPYHSAHVRFIARAGEEFDAAAEDLKLGAMQDSASHEYLQQHHARSTQIHVFEQRDAMYAQLADGKLDAILDDALIGFNWLVKPDHMGHDFVGEVIDVNRKSAMVFRSDNTGLRDRFNEGLEMLLSRGIYERINRNYFPFKTN